MAISGTDWLEVPTIYKAYFLGLCKGISPQNMALYGTVPPILVPEMTIEVMDIMGEPSLDSYSHWWIFRKTTLLGEPSMDRDNNQYFYGVMDILGSPSMDGVLGMEPSGNF